MFDAAGGIKEVPVEAPGTGVLTDARVAVLGRAATRIQQAFAAPGPVDVEWLFEGDKLWIVQARPYVRR